MKFMKSWYLLSAGTLMLSSGFVTAAATVSGATWDAALAAIKSGKLEEVKKYVTAHGPLYPWNKTRGGNTLLSVAIYENKPAIVQYFKMKKRDASGRDWEALTKAFQTSGASAVRDIVPFVIPETATTRGGNSLLKFAQDNKASDSILNYLKALGAPGATTPVTAKPAGSDVYDPKTGIVTYFDAQGNKKKGIGFYDKDAQYYEFTNFYMAPITIDGVTWPSTEHYFQAQKFNYPGASVDARDTAQRIQVARFPGDAFALAQNFKHLVRKDWAQVKRQVMEKAVQAKFFQHKSLADLLMSTHPSPIIELAVKNGQGVDFDWGYPIDFVTGKPLLAPHDGKPGKNMLGEILVQTRDMLLKQGASVGAPAVPKKAATQARPSVTSKAAPSEKEKNIQRIWDIVQPLLVKYSNKKPAPGRTLLDTRTIWDIWNDADWKTKETIISSIPGGAGEVWDIDTEFANFLVTYMQDYTTTADREALVNLVGPIVPTLYGTGESLDYQNIRDLISPLGKIAKNTADALTERLKLKFGKK